MKKSVSKVLWIIFVLCFLTGCQKSENYQEMSASRNDILPIYEEDDEEISVEKSAITSLQDVYDSGYLCEEWNIAEIEKPGGIACLEDELIISDCENDIVCRLSYEGKLLQTIGETGSGESEFLSPGAVEEYNNEIYVLDQGNNRIQVFDYDLNYIREIKLENKKAEDPDYLPQRISVNDKGIYVTGLSLRNPVVDHYDGDAMEELGKNFIGAISSYDSRLYLINSMGRYYDRANDSFGAVTSAPCWLMTVEGKELKKICELPHGFNIMDFVISNKSIVGISGTGSSVYSFSLEGEYVETIAIIAGLEEEEAPQISQSKRGEYFIVMPIAGKAYRCHKEN